MANKKTTRRALFMSVISMVLCVAMLVGTTFAWFTDEVTSGINTITAGNLDVELYYGKGKDPDVSVQDKTDIFTDTKGDAIEKWEPGVVAYTNLKVANEGNLALKYQLTINFSNMNYVEYADGNRYTLADALKVAIVEDGFEGGRAEAHKLAEEGKMVPMSSLVLSDEMEADAESDVYGVVIYWQPTDNDNLFNMNNTKTTSDGKDLHIDLGVNLYATQLDVEEDSFGSDYDESANMKATANADGSAVLTAASAPSAATNETTVEAPAGAFKDGDEVEIVVKARNTLFNVNSNGAVVASIDVTLLVNGEAETDELPEGKVYTVKTYISKDLDPGSIGVSYTGTDKDQPKFVSYDPRTGLLVFTTNHFSEYEVSAKAYGYNEATDTAYATAKDAADAIVDGAVVTIADADKQAVKNELPAEQQKEFNEKYAVARVGSQTYFLTFADAMNHAASVTGATVTLLTDTTMDADNTITIPSGIRTTLDLNGYTLSGVADGTGNREMFLVKGTLVVKNGTMEMTATQNQGWNAMTTIFDVTAGGVLKIEDATLENLGGTDMAFCVHLNNWGEVTLDAENVKFRSPYVGIRVFNSGNDQNNVTLKDCDILTGNSCLWVHNYTAADFGNDADKTAAAAKRLNFKFNNVTIARTNGSKSLIRYGMTDAIYYSGTDMNEVVAGNANALVWALENEKNVLLNNDIKIDPANMSNAYGTTGLNVKKGQTIDGNGYVLDVKGAGGTWDSGINTTGGTIKNIKVTGSFRGIFINHNSDHSEKVILENVTLEGVTYTISCDQGMKQNLKATNCTFNGWTSFAATIGTAEFVECNFGEGNGYAFCRPYAPTTFVGCEFAAGFEMDPRAAVTFENCTLNGVALTAENLATLVTSNIENATVK